MESTIDVGGVRTWYRESGVADLVLSFLVDDPVEPPAPIRRAGQPR